MDEQSEVKRGKGGRTALPDEQRRSIRKEVWLSPVELTDLKVRAAAVGITPGEYMRRAITSTPMPKPPVPELNMTAWRELARLAANANQYQHAINTGVDSRWDRALIMDLVKLVRELRLSLLGIDPDD